MFSQDVIPLRQLTEYANLRYLKKILSNKNLQESALAFTASSKNQLAKKTMSIIPKDDTIHSLNSLCRKQFI